MGKQTPAIGNIIGVDNEVSDDSILSNLWISSIIGGCVLLLFCVLQRTSLLYQYRLVANHVHVKPPRLRRRGLAAFTDWAIKAITTSDVDFVQTAGLDALIMVKLCALGVQMLLPMCLLGLIVLIPLHWYGSKFDDSDVYHIGFMRITMSSIPKGSKLFWVHFVFIYLYMGWSMLLLRWHYHQYLTIRQHYLKRGDDVNLWRDLYHAQPSDRPTSPGGNLRTFFSTLPLIKALLPKGVPTDSLIVQDGVEPVKDSDDDGEVGDEPAVLRPSMLHGPSSMLRSRRFRAISGPSRNLTSNYSLNDRRNSQIGAPTMTAASGLPSVSRQSMPPSTSSAANGPLDCPVSTGGDDGDGLQLPLAPIHFHSLDGKPAHGGSSNGPMVTEHRRRRHSAKLPRVDSEEQDMTGSKTEAAVGATAEAPGREEGSAVPPRRRGNQRRKSTVSGGGGAAGPVAEGVEDPSASTSVDLAPVPAASSETPMPPHATPEPSVGNGQAASDPANASMAPLPRALVTPAVAEDEISVKMGVTTDGGGEGRSSSKVRHATFATPAVDDNRDVEAGLPTLSRELNDATDPPASSPGMARSASLDTEAHLLEWWWDGGELVRPDSTVEGAYLSAQGEPLVSRSWPSVSHRKTVNAITWDGRQRAVLAQHYAVLVMDVVERKPAADERSKGELGAGGLQMASIRAAPRRLASYLPLCLRRWCNLGYGNQAAKKMALESTSMATSEASADGTAFKTPTLGSQVRGSATRSRASDNTSFVRNHSDQPMPDLPLARPMPLTAVRGHRRTYSTGDAVLPASDPPPVRKLSSPRHVDPYGKGGDSRRSIWTAGNANGASRRPGPGPGGGGGRGNVPQLLRGFDLLTERARSALEDTLAHSGSMGPLPSRLSQPGQAGPSRVGPANSSLYRGEFSLPVLHRHRAQPSAGAVETGAEGVPQAQSQLQADGQSSVAGRTGQAGGRFGVLAHCGTLAAVSAPAGQGAHAAPANPTQLGADSLGPSRGPGPVAEADEQLPPSQGKGEDDSAEQAPPVEAPAVSTEPEATEPHPAARGPCDSSLRRRRGTAGDGDSAADVTVDGEKDGSSKARGSEAGSGGGPRGWDLVREAVYDGRVAMLPMRRRYSVVSATFSRLFPDEFDRAVPVINFKEVDLLLMRVDWHMAQYEYAKLYEEQTGKELYGRIGFCGLFGERKRRRMYHTEEVNKLMVQVRDARRRAFDQGPTPSWFVFFHTQRAAAMASQCLIHAEDNRQFRVHPAPGPDEVNWPTLWSDFRARDLRCNLMRPLVAVVVAIPIGIFGGALMQLDYVLCPAHICVDLEPGSQEWDDNHCSASLVSQERKQLSWDWYCDQEDFVAKVLKQFVVGWLPSLLVTLWQGMVLPLVFTYTVQTSRQARSLSEADRAIAKNMFYFAVFNVFLGGVVGSTIIQSLNEAIKKGPSEILNLIGTFVPTSSNFFINYTLFRALVALPLRMLWPHIGIRMYLLRRYLRFSCLITPREQAFLMAPVSPRYGFEVGMVLLIFVIAFAFSVVSPMLLPLAVLFFAMAWLFWRWALLYVYVRKYESGGTMFPFIYRCIMVCLGIFPVFTACVFVTKHAYVQAIIVLVTIPVILTRFSNYCYYRFQTGMNAMPLEAAVRAPPAVVEPSVYYPPPLLPNLAGWNPDWSKCWQGWNLPVVYG